MPELDVRRISTRMQPSDKSPGATVSRLEFFVRLADVTKFDKIERADAIVLRKNAVWIILDGASNDDDAFFPYKLELPIGSKGFTRRKLVEMVSQLVKSVMYDGIHDPNEVYDTDIPFDELVMFCLQYDPDGNYCRLQLDRAPEFVRTFAA